MRIAFYAPMKAPDHPVPSGERAMARALMAALAAVGHGVSLVSRLRSWQADPDAAAMRAVAAEADREADRLGAAWRVEGPPDLWFTYHSYYRAPDLLGPRLAARFGRPYVLAEASHAEKRAPGPWAAWHAANAAAIRAAALHLCFTRRDADGLGGRVSPERLVMLSPFLAEPPRAAPPRRPRSDGRPVRLLAAAMMRPGKVRSYALLAKALAMLPAALDWRLAIAGDGPAREAVAAAFAALPPGRIAWTGLLSAEALAAAYAEADLFVWPGFREPFGVVYLEAQGAGLPVLAMASGGVESVVADGRTGILVPEGDAAAYAAALARLIADPSLRARLGRAARRMVAEERTLAPAAAILDRALGRVMRDVPCPTP